MSKDYLAGMVDLTGNAYLNPVGAQYGDGSGTHSRNEGIITEIAIHHDATPRPHDYDSVARYTQEAAGHYDRLGPGLQYHYKIDNTGVIFKVRPHTTWLYAVGSQANVTTINICLDGYFHAPNNEVPTREQYEALKSLLDWLCTQNPQFPANQSNVFPHRHFSSTACCGDLLVPFVDGYRNFTAAGAVPDSAVYDWPELQPISAPVTTTQPTPQSPEPVPVATEVPDAIPTTTSTGMPASTDSPVESSGDTEETSPLPSSDGSAPTTSQPESSSPSPDNTQPTYPVQPQTAPPEQSQPIKHETLLTFLYKTIILQGIRGIKMNFGKYRKSVVAVVGVLVTLLTVALGVDSPIVIAVVQLLTAFGVYQVKNDAL